MSIQRIAKEINEVFPLDVAQTEWDNVGILIDTGSQNKNLLLTIDITDEVIEECLDKNITNIVAYHPVIFNGIKKIQSSDIVAKLFKYRINVFCPHTSWDPTINRYIYTIFNNRPFIGNSGPNYWSIREVIGELKSRTNIKYLRVGLGKKHGLDTVPVSMVVGVGAAFKYHKYKNCVIITGEMTHHVILHSVRNNNTVIILEHSDSERIALNYFWKVLCRVFPDYNVVLSQADRDPIKIYL
jgi:putative NIF3 family GTP cyclohydrolase 1 type 2